MPDDSQPKKRSLSEISHLFLSSVRDRQTEGSRRPRRMPPERRPHLSIDLTPEEFAQVYGDASPAAENRKIVPVTAVIGAHLNGKQFDRVKEYARHLAANIGRVGLIELDAAELRLMCFDPSAPAGPGQPENSPVECAEPRQMAEALEEMNWDIDEWVLLLPNPRTPESMALLRQVDQWVLLSTCDHDGVVSSYRMLKALAGEQKPRLSLALLDHPPEEVAGRVFQKLSGVCQQFLQWPIEPETSVQSAPGVSEHLVLLYRPTRDKAQMASSPQFAAVGEFLAAGKAAESSAAKAPADPASPQMATDDDRQLLADVIVPNELAPTAPGSPDSAAPPRASAPVAPAAMPVTMPLEATPAPAAPSPPAAAGFDDVIDLPGHDASGESILAAVLHRCGGDLAECPVRPPMTVAARLAVARDRGLVLLAVASQGLAELRAIGQAYRWLTENRELIAMALPQFAINPQTAPRLRLLVDRADLSADGLQPMLQSGNVTLQPYRKLRWGEKLGVFLEAA